MPILTPGVIPEPEQYVSPTGSIIVGTKELLTGRCPIRGIDENGVPIYSGERTEVFWDDQTTAKTADGKLIYLDEDGQEWTFDQLNPKTEDDDDFDLDGNEETIGISP